MAAIVFDLVVAKGQPAVVVSLLFSLIVSAFSYLLMTEIVYGRCLGQLARASGADTSDLDVGAHHLAETIHGVRNS